MAHLKYNSSCPCGAKIAHRIKKPTYFTNSFSKINCQECGSRFLMSCIRDREAKGKRIFTTHFDELEITEKALQVIRSKIPVKAKVLLDKVGLLPEEKPSQIETDLDRE